MTMNPALAPHAEASPERPLTAGALRRSPGLALAVFAAAEILAAWALAQTGGFWSPDSALRFVQVEHLVRTHSGELAIPYPAAALDPDGRYFPFGAWFHFARDGRYYLSYQPYFSVVSAPLYRLAGWPGLLLLPAASGLGVVWLTYGVLRDRAPDLAGLAALAAGLATPVFVYSVLFWDHTLAALLGAGALAVLAREMDGRQPARGWRIAAAGALLGTGFWLRNEMYPLAVAAGIGWLAVSSRARLGGLARLAGGAALPAACLWAINMRLVGMPFGWKGHDLVTTRVSGVAHAASRPAPWLAEKLGNAYYQLASPDFYAFSPRAVAVGLILAVALIGAGLLLRAAVARGSAAILTAGAALGIAAGLVILSGRTAISGLLPAAPVVVLALLPGPLAAWERFLWVVSVLFTAAVVITGTHGGLQWGPRYLLPILPVLVWLSAAAVARARARAPRLWPALRTAAAGLVAVSIAAQLSGVDQAFQGMARNARLNEDLRRAPAAVIVTPLEWLTVGAGSVYFEKTLMLVRTPEDLRPLVQRLSEARVDRWTYVPYSGFMFAPGTVEALTAGNVWRFSLDDDRSDAGLRFVTYVGRAGAP